MRVVKVTSTPAIREPKTKKKHKQSNPMIYCNSIYILQQARTHYMEGGTSRLFLFTFVHQNVDTKWTLDKENRPLHASLLSGELATMWDTLEEAASRRVPLPLLTILFSSSCSVLVKPCSNILHPSR